MIKLARHCLQFALTCAHLLPHGEEAGGRVRQVEVGVHLQLGDVVGHVQERLGIHVGFELGYHTTARGIRGLMQPKAQHQQHQGQDG